MKGKVTPFYGLEKQQVGRSVKFVGEHGMGEKYLVKVLRGDDVSRLNKFGMVHKTSKKNEFLLWVDGTRRGSWYLTTETILGVLTGAYEK